MAKEMRMPGFRAGKAPPSLVIQRLGFGPVLQEAIRDALPEWYELALFDAGVSPIGDPSIEMVSTPENEAEALNFKFEVGVRPEAKLGTYKGLEVGREEKEVPDEIVDTEVERVREGFARLEPVEREAAEGDSLLIDFEGFMDGAAFEGGAAEDYLLALGSRAEEDFRVAAIDAAVAEASVEVPAELATARATERWERMERQLAQRGMDPNQFLQMQGKTRDELIEETKEDAEKELRREAVVAAIAEAEAIEVSEEEMVEALEHSAEHERTTPEKLLERLRSSGRDAMIREDLRARKAIELVADSAKPIPKEQADERQGKAEAREKLLAPDAEKPKAGGLWTPGD
jgi:trigger factor